MVTDPKRKARVEIRQVKEQMGMLPWAVPEIDPAAVAAIFVDENNGSVIGHQLLMKQDIVSLPFSEWKTSVFEEQIDLASENTGVVILVSKNDDAPTLTTGGPGTLTAICSQAPDLVACYAGDGNQDGLTFIHGWSDIPGDPANPQIRDVSLINVNCTDDLSAPYFLLTGDCDLGATAVIDFGVTGNPALNPPNGIRAQMKLKGPGCGGQGCTMSYAGPASSPTESYWTAAAGAFLDPASGRATYSLLADETSRSHILEHLRRGGEPVRRERLLWSGALSQANDLRCRRRGQPDT